MEWIKTTINSLRGFTLYQIGSSNTFFENGLSIEGTFSFKRKNVAWYTLSMEPCLTISFSCDYKDRWKDTMRKKAFFLPFWTSYISCFVRSRGLLEHCWNNSQHRNPSYAYRCFRNSYFTFCCSFSKKREQGLHRKFKNPLL